MGGICFEPDGDVTIITGMPDYGQGMPRPLPRCSPRGSAFRSSDLPLQGDSDQPIAGGGTADRK
jgi:carbon-monoxide dehydrogenase large subunit